MNTDPLNPGSLPPAPADGGADERELQEALTFMRNFDDSRAGVAEPETGTPMSFAVASARALSGGTDDARMARAQMRVCEQLARSGVAPQADRHVEEFADPETTARRSIPLTSVLFARLFSRLGLGVLDVVVLLIALLIGSQVLLTLLKKSESKPVDTTAAQKKDGEKKQAPAGDEKPEKAEAPDPHWLDGLRPDMSESDMGGYIFTHASGEKIADLLAVAQDLNRDMFVRRSVIQYLPSRLGYPGVTDADRKAVGAAMLKFIADEQAPTLLKKSAVLTLTAVAEDAPEVKEQALPPLTVLAGNKETDAPLRAVALDALIRLDPVRTDKVIGVTAAESDPSVQETAFASLRDTLAKSPDAAAHLADATVATLVGVLSNDKAEIGVKVNAAEALAYAIRQGNAAARKAALPVIAGTIAKAQEARLVIGFCKAAEIMSDAEMVAPLAKTYGDFYDKNNPNHDTDARIAVLKAMRSYIARISTGKFTPTEADVKAGAEAMALLIQVIDDDPSSDCKREAMTGLKYAFSPVFKAQQRDAIEALIYLLADKKTDGMIKDEVVETLQSITSMDFGNDAVKWSHWFDAKYPGKHATTPPSEDAKDKH